MLSVELNPAHLAGIGKATQVLFTFIQKDDLAGSDTVSQTAYFRTTSFCFIVFSTLRRA